MAKAAKTTDALERMARSLDLLLRLKLHEVKNDLSQREAILLLGNMGAGGGEIASLLGISRTTVDPELSKARAAKKSKPSKRAKLSPTGDRRGK